MGQCPPSSQPAVAAAMAARLSGCRQQLLLAVLVMVFAGCQAQTCTLRIESARFLDASAPPPLPLGLMGVALFDKAGAPLAVSGARASSTWSDARYYPAGLPIANCLDGNSMTMCATNATDANPWMEFSYPCRQLGRVDITNRPDGLSCGRPTCAARIDRFIVRFINPDALWPTPLQDWFSPIRFAAFGSALPLYRIYPGDQCMIKIDLPAPDGFVTVANTTYLNLMEVRLLKVGGGLVPFEEITAALSSTFNNRPAYAVRSCFDRDATSTFCSTNTGDSNPSLTIGLRCSSWPAVVQVVNRPNYLSRLARFRVRYLTQQGTEYDAPYAFGPQPGALINVQTSCSSCVAANTESCTLGVCRCKADWHGDTCELSRGPAHASMVVAGGLITICDVERSVFSQCVGNVNPATGSSFNYLMTSAISATNVYVLEAFTGDLFVCTWSAATNTLTSCAASPSYSATVAAGTWTSGIAVVGSSYAYISGYPNSLVRCDMPGMTNCVASTPSVEVSDVAVNADRTKLWLSSDFGATWIDLNPDGTLAGTNKALGGGYPPAETYYGITTTSRGARETVLVSAHVHSYLWSCPGRGLTSPVVTGPPASWCTISHGDGLWSPPSFRNGPAYASMAVHEGELYVPSVVNGDDDPATYNGVVVCRDRVLANDCVRRAGPDAASANLFAGGVVSIAFGP